MGKLTAAEKQRRYREKRKLDPERENAFKEKHKLRNGKRKKVNEMGKQEKRMQQKRWQQYDRNRRLKQLASVPVLETPPRLPLTGMSEFREKAEIGIFAQEQESEDTYIDVSLDLVDDPDCHNIFIKEECNEPWTFTSPSTPHQLPSPVQIPLQRNSPSRDEAGPSRLSQFLQRFLLPSTPLPVSQEPSENVENRPPASGPSTNWLKRKRRPNASVRSAEALSAATLSRKTAVEKESLQRMVHAKKEHELRMVLLEEEVLALKAKREEEVLLLRAKRAYYERGNKSETS